MPISANELFGTAGLSVAMQVRWGAHVPSDSPGVYCVSLSSRPDRNGGTLAEAPISVAALHSWLERVQGMQLNNEHPSADELACFLARFWLPDENILYVARATCLSKRIPQLFRHGLGDRKPHRGGHWLKTLTVLDRLKLFIAPCRAAEKADQKESELLNHFVAQVSKASRARVADPNMPLPFANLERPTRNGRPRKQRALSRCTVAP